MLAESSLTPRMAETILIFGIPAIAILCTFIWLIIRSLAEIALKRDMVARGMSVEEMREVLRLGKRH